MTDSTINARIAGARAICEETLRFLKFLRSIDAEDREALEAARVAHAEMIERRNVDLFKSMERDPARH